MWPKGWRHQSTSLVKESVWCKLHLHTTCGTTGSRRVCFLISCLGYNENEPSWRIKKMIKFFIFMQIGYNTYDRNIQTNYFFKNKDPAMFFFLFEIISVQLFSFHGCRKVFVKRTFWISLTFTCLYIKTLKKKRAFCSPFFLKYLPSISVSEKPMTGFSAIKKIIKSPVGGLVICFSTLNPASFGSKHSLTKIYSRFGYFSP